MQDQHEEYGIADLNEPAMQCHGVNDKIGSLPIAYSNTSRRISSGMSKIFDIGQQCIRRSQSLVKGKPANRHRPTAHSLRERHSEADTTRDIGTPYRGRPFDPGRRWLAHWTLVTNDDVEISEHIPPFLPPTINTTSERTRR